MQSKPPFWLEPNWPAALYNVLGDRKTWAIATSPVWLFTTASSVLAGTSGDDLLSATYIEDIEQIEITKERPIEDISAVNSPAQRRAIEVAPIQVIDPDDVYFATSAELIPSTPKVQPGNGMIPAQVENVSLQRPLAFDIAVGARELVPEGEDIEARSPGKQSRFRGIRDSIISARPASDERSDPELQVTSPLAELPQIQPDEELFSYGTIEPTRYQARPVPTEQVSAKSGEGSKYTRDGIPQIVQDARSDVFLREEDTFFDAQLPSPSPQDESLEFDSHFVDRTGISEGYPAKGSTGVRTTHKQPRREIVAAQSVRDRNREIPETIIREPKRVSGPQDVILKPGFHSFAGVKDTIKEIHKREGAPEAIARNVTGLSDHVQKMTDEGEYTDFSILDSPLKVPLQESIQSGNHEQAKLALDLARIPATRPVEEVLSRWRNPPNISGDVLSLPETILYMLKNNPEIGEAFWETQDKIQALRLVKTGNRPSVSLSANYGVENTAGDDAAATYGINRNDATFRIRQKLVDFGKTRQDVKRAESLLQSQRLLQRQAVEDTLLDTVQAYFDLMAVELLVDNAEENVERHREIYNLVELNVEAGNATEADQKRALTRMEKARSRKLDLNNQRQAAIGNFRKITGLDPGRLIEPQIDLEQIPLLSLENIDDIIREKPVIQSAVRDSNSLYHQMTSLKRERMPELGLDVTAKYQENVLGEAPWTTEYRAMLNFTMDLYDGGARSTRVNQVRARYMQNEQRIQSLRNELKEEAYNIISVLETSANKTALIEEQVNASEQVMDLYTAQFEAGRRTLLELLDAQADLSTAKEESITNRYERLTALFASEKFQNRLIETIVAQMGITIDYQG